MDFQQIQNLIQASTVLTMAYQWRRTAYMNTFSNVSFRIKTCTSLTANIEQEQARYFCGFFSPFLFYLGLRVGGVPGEQSEFMDMIC